jgi:hypothetical protein
MSIVGYEKALEAAGFTVKGATVYDHMGIEVAGTSRDGFWTKSNLVDSILAQPLKVETIRVRTRGKEGQFIADDPSTPDINEAWTTITKKKVTKK